MKLYRNLFLVFAFIFCIAPLSAQTIHSLYFLEGNNQRNTLNPAFTSDHSYVTFPLLGNFNVNINSNLGLGAIMTPRGNEMVTFLHSSISADDALSKFKKTNVLEADIDLNILTVGFNAFNGSNTIGISVRSRSGVYLPKDLFTFLKLGQNQSGDTEYNFSDITATSQSYVEFALGHAHQLNDKLSIGAKVKFLVGAEYAEATADDVSIKMSGNKWVINEKSSLIGSKGMNFVSDSNGEITDVKFENFGVAGYGFGLDLGAVYKITPEATVTLAVTDIGFINWKDCSYATNKHQSFEFDGFDNIATEDNADGSNSFDDAADEVWDNLKCLVKFNDDGKKSKSTSLYTTVRASGEYGILKNKISFGLLASMRFGAPITWTEAMLTANFRPCGWFNAAINGSWSNVRSSIGAVINLHSRKGVNFFIGGDYLLAKYSKQFIPVDAAKLNVGFGLSFNF